MTEITGSTSLLNLKLSSPETAAPRVVIKGKFFSLGDDKLFIKGVTYGPFGPVASDAAFPSSERVEQDLTLIKELGANCIRTFTVPPRWLLDKAWHHGLRILAGIYWTQHLSFMESRAQVRHIYELTEKAAEACMGHPAIFGYLIGNEIPPDIVRWYGPGRVQKFLKQLASLVKKVDSQALVSYGNYPSTEYLDVSFSDFLAFNVYLHREPDFRRYLSRLHNLAQDKPLVMTEVGIDSIREGKEAQAEILSWQVQAAYESGASGIFIFSWTDEWFSGGYPMKDWAFGLVDEGRAPKPSFHAVQQRYGSPLAHVLESTPKISVVVCAYNAERTLAPCLASLERLRYPHYEVIVINDGSTDGTLEIANRYKQFRVISQENKGLSAARNAGIEAAAGEIVAFTDADCVADPDWLMYLASRFAHSDFAGVGGPNLSPREEDPIPSCVALSPGRPTHILIDDEIAEHIPGCNMAFYKDALEKINGFDPVFRTAGDDVDICWRLQDAGYKIGFSPAAMVWHFRRNTVNDYLKQQRGYGRAESLLYFKHPYRFNVMGQARWLGRIYEDLEHFLLIQRPVIYYGTFGRALFQTLYEPPLHPFYYLPFTLEWNISGLCLLTASLWVFPHLSAVAALPLIFSLFAAFFRAMRAQLDPNFRGVKTRLLLTFLIYTGPLVRSFERYRTFLGRLNQAPKIFFERESRQKPRLSWLKRQMFFDYWTDAAHDKEDLLRELRELLHQHSYFVSVDQGWTGWDLEIQRKVWSKLKVLVAMEKHDQFQRLLRVKCRLFLTPLAKFMTASLILLVAAGCFFQFQAEIKTALISIAVIIFGVILYDGIKLSRIVFHAFETVAAKMNLHPVKGKPWDLSSAS